MTYEKKPHMKWTNQRWEPTGTWYITGPYSSKLIELTEYEADMAIDFLGKLSVMQSDYVHNRLLWTLETGLAALLNPASVHGGRTLKEGSDPLKLYTKDGEIAWAEDSILNQHPEYVRHLADADLSGYNVGGIRIRSVEKHKTGYWVNLGDGTIIEAKAHTKISDLEAPAPPPGSGYRIRQYGEFGSTIN